MDFIPFGIRNRIIRFLFPVGTKYEFDIPFYGNRYKGNLDSYIDYMVFFYGAYDKPALELLKKIADNIEAPIFFDIGANIGQHSLFMSSYCKEVHAFEPFIEVRKLILEKQEINNIRNLKIHDFGLGEVNETRNFFAPSTENKGTGSFIEDYNESNQNIGSLKIVKGDDFVFENLNPSKIDLMKIDVEGFERNVLLGLKKTLDHFRPILFVEYSAATMNSFIDSTELQGMLPDNYIIKKFKSNNVDFSKLIDFDPLISGGDIVILPNEKINLIE
ncbi:FkbM family methyltransferase [bacterium]|nr:FkbM family methyltransferase [bacterium]